MDQVRVFDEVENLSGTVEADMITGSAVLDLVNSSPWLMVHLKYIDR